MSDPSTPIASAPPEVLVNGETRLLPPEATVAALITALDLGGKRVAVALNREIVPRSRYAEVELSPGDRIEILEAVGGG